jgi:hypothetical protein
LPLSIVKSFLAGFFRGSRARPISLAVVQLDFQDIEFRTSLSDAATPAWSWRTSWENSNKAAASPG